MDSRYEVLPFGSAVQEAADAPSPLTLTVTSSPRQGIDGSLEIARQLVALGHRPVVHLAARMIGSADHLDAVLGQIVALGSDEAFVIGGDTAQPVGPYESATALLQAIVEHPHRPRRIGIAAYPEGHPLIDSSVLREALQAKVALGADYATTQMCFDAEALLGWLADARGEGFSLPVYMGVPGQVDRRRLLEISMRVGVGTSLAVLRKQRGLRHLLGRPRAVADELLDALAGSMQDPSTGIAGIHYFTFNQLNATLAWEQRRADDRRATAVNA